MPKSKNPSKRVELIRGSYNLFVFDPHGKELLKLIVAEDAENVDQLANAIDKIAENLGKEG